MGLLKTLSTFSFIARWPNFFGVVLDIGSMLIGIHLPLRICGGALIPYRFGLRGFWVSWAVICWSLWATRNKFTIEHIFPAKPVSCLFKANVFLQQWRLLTKEADLEALDDMLSMMRSTASSLLR